MMRQYLEIKKDNPDSILFFRLGDFYEMFADDAKIASKELDLALTSRDHGKHQKPAEEQIPMCGIPYHASDAYIARLISRGYKVAICEQTEDPAKAKGLVKRDVIRVVTPGTVTDAACLQDKASNFLCGIYLDKSSGGVCFCDISTGKTHLTAFTGKDCAGQIVNELGRFSPVEAILNDGAFESEGLLTALRQRFSCRVEHADHRFRLSMAEKAIRVQFGDEGWGKLPAANPAAALSLGGLLSYLYETQKADLSYIRDLEYYAQGVFLELDLTARRNLELTETLQRREKRGSLLWVLDETKTPMGGRMLRAWLERPLRSVTAIARRSAAVESLTKDSVARGELMAALQGFGDMERILGRVVYGSAGGRDLAALRSAMERLPGIRAQMAAFSDRRLSELREAIDPLEDVAGRIAETLCDEPPFSVREGGLIRDGYHAELDQLRDILSGGKGFLTELEQREKEKTGIRTLKVGYNKVFGYYIEVSNAFRDQVPADYIRKQTLVNGERYITQELKELEHTVLTASDRAAALEYELFTQLRQEVAAQAPRIQSCAAAVAELDALCSLAEVAVRNRYCRPEVDESGVIEIHGGRHPVVEQMLSDALFVPNDTFMGAAENRVAIITGPNMAGKSTYMRQVALIVLMAQMGSFVPASAARIGLVDRIFTRIGASDDLSGGRSTFMVEMSEVSEILREATPQSLLILDEIGRGTSTFDGESLAQAVLEYCADRKTLGARTLFATHYHELTELEGKLPGAANFNIAVKARGDEIIFLRKILPGGADRSYGIEVAKLAGIPEKVLKRARTILTELESQSDRPRRESAPQEQMTFGSAREEEVLDALRRSHPDALTPLEAMQLLYELKKKLE